MADDQDGIDNNEEEMRGQFVRIIQTVHPLSLSLCLSDIFSERA